MSNKVFVSVFRSSKKADTYLFVKRGQVWEELPESLLAVFGTGIHSMDLVMTPERKLARTTGKQVLDAIEDKGFYLQMSEENNSFVVDFRKKPESEGP